MFDKKAYLKEYYQKNKEKFNAYAVKRKTEKSEELKDYYRQYDKLHRVHRRDNEQRYRDRKREKIRQANAVWVKENKDQFKATQKKYRNKPEVRMAVNLRRRLLKALWNKTDKCGSVISDLGMPMSEFKLYMEKKFQSGMTWENYGKAWHIDHIKPISSFDLSDRPQFLKACHFTNLQPLWAKDNIRKGNKIWCSHRFLFTPA